MAYHWVMFSSTASPSSWMYPQWWLPSGKHTENYGKIHHAINGKTHYKHIQKTMDLNPPCLSIFHGKIHDFDWAMFKFANWRCLADGYFGNFRFTTGFRESRYHFAW
jgi:hypothetical protein